MTRGARIAAALIALVGAVVSANAGASNAGASDAGASDSGEHRDDGTAPGVDAEGLAGANGAAFELGEWDIAPHVELRLRGEYRRDPVDVGGDVFEGVAVHGDGYRSPAPAVFIRQSAVGDLWLASSRARLGLRASRRFVAAVVTLQDARVLGWLPGAAASASRPGTGIFEPYRAYLELFDDAVRDGGGEPLVRARIGRQPITWGEGRLVGDKDWLARGGALDAARVELQFGDGLTEVELLAAMLAMPGPVPQPLGSTTGAARLEGSGAQLYGLANRWDVFPLLKLELGVLARIAREPLPVELVRGDTYVVDLRVHGAWRGVDYAAEGALELGRVASFGTNRELFAGAAAARVDWQTALPLDVRFGAFGSYASGDDSGGTGATQHRFDPILPTVHEHHGMMDLLGWSNSLDVGARVAARPLTQVDVALRYAFLGLAEPTDRWTAGSLAPIGVAPANDSRSLAHELDLRVAYEPWRGVSFDAGYGIAATGSGARAILEASGHGAPELLHFAYLATSARVW